MVILFNRWRVWGGGGCPFFRTSRDVKPGTPPAAAGGIPAAAAAEHPLWRGAHCVPWRGYAAPPHAMEGDGAEPPPERTPGRATARRPGRATRPTPRRARLGAPPAVTGEKAQGTHAGRPGLPTPAGRPASTAQRTIVGRGRRRAAARRLRRARREAPPRPSSPR